MNYDIIVPAESPNMSSHIYQQVYGGRDGCTLVLNATTVNVAPQSLITITVKSVSGGTGCYLLGNNKDVYTGVV